MSAETGIKLSPKTSGVLDSLARNGFLRDGGSNAVNGDCAGVVAEKSVAASDEIDAGGVTSGRAESFVAAGGDGAILEGSGFAVGVFGAG